MNYILALDQGTTSSRSLLYDLSGKVIASSAYEYSISHPKPNWVEQDPLEIWSTQLQSLKDVLCEIDPSKVLAIGITNQRETIIAWNKITGEPLVPAIVWQCKRTANYCSELKSTSWVEKIKLKTGLTIDPYFSATKIRWLIQNNPKVQAAYKEDQCIFGTVDSWLIYQLTKDSDPHFLTDASNASRTMLYNIESLKWDAELLGHFEVKQSSLCQVLPSNSNFGRTKLLGLDAPITGVLGDQQSSLLGHQGVHNNDLKCTFGTGAFLLKNTGNKLRYSDHGLLSTIAWQLKIADKLETTYALEGSIFIAGSLIKWLRDKLQIISSADQVEQLALQSDSSKGLVIIPAFSGLGAPIWDPKACGAMFGISADTSRSEIAYASLEAVADQVADLLAISELKNSQAIKIDGGMIKNNLFNQILANLTQTTILVNASCETTAYGAFLIAGYGANLFNPFKDSILAEPPIKFSPKINQNNLSEHRKLWRKAVAKVQNWHE